MRAALIVTACFLLFIPLLLDAQQQERDVKTPVTITLKDGRTQNLKLDWIDENKVVGFTHGDLRPVTFERGKVASVSFDGDQSGKFAAGQQGLVTREGAVVLGHVAMTGANAISVKPDRGPARTYGEEDVAFIKLGDAERKTTSPGESLIVTVPASEQWTDTRMDLRQGEHVWFTVSPRDLVSCSSQLQDINPDGADPYFLDPRRPLPEVKGCALIARIGSKNEPFRVGLNTTPFVAKEDGRLYLGLNDYDFRDNSGEFSVYIRVGDEK